MRKIKADNPNITRQQIAEELVDLVFENPKMDEIQDSSDMEDSDDEDSKPTPKKETKECKKQSTGLDSKYEYSRALVFCGLFLRAMRDAVRENDGDRMLLHWRWLMPYFYEEGHKHYFILTERLLLSVAGAVSQRLAQQITWNRTISNNGGIGKNIAGDLKMEHLIGEYKGKCKKSFP